MTPYLKRILTPWVEERRRKLFMDYEHLPAREENAHMSEFVGIGHDFEYDVHWELHKVGLTSYMGKWKIDLKILKQLLLSNANVYELRWKRLRDSDVHYSTVLRALRRLERRKFVRIVSSGDAGRRRKTYACTLLGELLVALARNGLQGASRIIAESSTSFRECVKMHLPFDPNYCERLTMKTIEEILRSKEAEAVARPDLDFYVRSAEFKWVRKNILEELNSFSTRPKILRYLRKATCLGWLSEWLMPVLDKHVEVESEWLQSLKDLSRETKLSRFFLKKVM